VLVGRRAKKSQVFNDVLASSATTQSASREGPDPLPRWDETPGQRDGDFLDSPRPPFIDCAIIAGTLSAVSFTVRDNEFNAVNAQLLS
jgi:hypothetical protein